MMPTLRCADWPVPSYDSINQADGGRCLRCLRVAEGCTDATRNPLLLPTGLRLRIVDKMLGANTAIALTDIPGEYPSSHIC